MGWLSYERLALPGFVWLLVNAQINHAEWKVPIRSRAKVTAEDVSPPTSYYLHDLFLDISIYNELVTSGR